MMNQEKPVHSAMSLRDLKNLIRSGEGLSLEFKRAISSPEKIAREIAAFANTHGGNLLIGVDDDGSLIGVESYLEQDFYLEQAANDLCTPAISYRMEIIPCNDREILLVHINEALKKPVSVRNGNTNAAYVRMEDQSVRASDEMTAVMKQKASKKGITFRYGAYEQKLFRYLNEYPHITVDQYSRLADIHRKKASRILVDLTSLGILKMINEKQHVCFTLST